MKSSMSDKEKDAPLSEGVEPSQNPSRRDVLAWCGTAFLGLLLSTNLGVQNVFKQTSKKDSSERLAQATGMAKRPSSHLAEIPKEQFEKAEKALRSAYQYIQTNILPGLEKNHQGLRNNGLKMVQALLKEPFEPQQYLSLMVKESHLNPAR